MWGWVFPRTCLVMGLQGVAASTPWAGSVPAVRCTVTDFQETPVSIQHFLLLVLIVWEEMCLRGIKGCSLLPVPWWWRFYLFFKNYIQGAQGKDTQDKVPLELLSLLLASLKYRHAITHNLTQKTRRTGRMQWLIMTWPETVRLLSCNVQESAGHQQGTQETVWHAVAQEVPGGGQISSLCALLAVPLPAQFQPHLISRKTSTQVNIVRSYHSGWTCTHHSSLASHLSWAHTSPVKPFTLSHLNCTQLKSSFLVSTRAPSSYISSCSFHPPACSIKNHGITIASFLSLLPNME